jgi:hypothetical protein
MGYLLNKLLTLPIIIWKENWKNKFIIIKNNNVLKNKPKPEAKDVYTENYKTLPKENKDTNE